MMIRAVLEDGCTRVLELAFNTKSLLIICQRREEAAATFGEIVAVKLFHRLADLRAADSPVDLPAGNPRANDSYYEIDVVDGTTIVFIPNHQSTPILSDGNIDWEDVFRIKILSIGGVK